MEVPRRFLGIQSSAHQSEQNAVQSGTCLPYSIASNSYLAVRVRLATPPRVAVEAHMPLCLIHLNPDIAICASYNWRGYLIQLGCDLQHERPCHSCLNFILYHFLYDIAEGRSEICVLLSSTWLECWSVTLPRVMQLCVRKSIRMHRPVGSINIVQSTYAVGCMGI